MARGKKARSAANHRVEAAYDTIDRLTETLADAKVKARQYEYAAKRLPIVEAELARLRVQVAEGTSDELERVRALGEKREAESAAVLAEARKHFNALLIAAEDPDVPPPAESVGVLDKLGLLDEWIRGSNREERRWREQGRSAFNGRQRLQDNLRSRADNRLRDPLPPAPLPGEAHVNDAQWFPGEQPGADNWPKVQQ